MKSLQLISIGRLREEAYLKTEQNYYKRLKTFQTSITEVKSQNDQKDLEAQQVLKKIDGLKKKSPLFIVLLTERGQKFNSHDFSNWLYKTFEKHSSIALIIGGSAGHGQELYQAADQEISLSSLTFPHHMVRAILAEQLYRAETIYQGHPYSK